MPAPDQTIEDMFLLSPFQAYLFSHPDAGLQQLTVPLHVPLSPLDWVGSLARLTAQQPALRTHYLHQSGRAYQVVTREGHPRLICIDHSGMASQDQAAALALLRRRMHQSVRRALQRAQVPILLILLKHAPANWALLMSAHGIALDETSQQALLQMLLGGCHSVPPELAVDLSLRAYFKHSSRPSTSPRSEHAPEAKLPTRRRSGPSEPQAQQRCWPEHLTAALDRLAIGLGHSPESARIALWGLLLCRMTDASALSLWLQRAPQGNRPMGQCNQLFRVQIQVTAETKFADLLQQIKRQDQPEQTPPDHPLLCCLTLSAPDTIEFPSALADTSLEETSHPGITIAVNWQTSTAGEHLRLRYDPQTYAPRMITALLAYGEHLAGALLAQPHTPLWQLPLAAPPAQSTIDPAPEPRDIAERFMACAQQFANQPALIYQGQSLCYGDLLAQVTDLAVRLRAHTPRQPKAYPPALLALALSHPQRHLIAVLAALVAQIPFVPLDVRQPAAHLRQILARHEVGLVLSEATLVCDLAVARLDWEALAPDSSFQPPRYACDQPAYLIPTSGTTGTPKAVLVSRAGLAHTLDWRVAAYAMRPGHRSLQVFAPNFDGYLTSALTPLLSGAALVLPQNPQDPSDLQALLRDAHITHLLITPSHLSALLDVLEPGDLAQLTTLTLAGEQLSAELVAHPALAHVTWINEYGPTENSIASSVQHRCRASEPVPIGRAIPGCGIEIVDRWGQPQPAYGRGELLLLGRGLALGYHQQAAATARSFRPHPREGRAYHSGDLGYRDTSATLFFCGRRDRQAKLRGYRVDPNELARRLAQHPRIERAHAEIMGVDQRAPQLIARYCGTISPSELRSWLEAKLPTWLQPSQLQQLNASEMTPP